MSSVLMAYCKVDVGCEVGHMLANMLDNDVYC